MAAEAWLTPQLLECLRTQETSIQWFSDFLDTLQVRID
jgi:hypothetical protein